MRVSEAMTRNVRVANPEETISDAARTMRDIDAGVLPVGENDRLVGMVTDRDIAIRAVADGKGPETKIREVMTPHLHWCYEDEDLEEVTRKMGDTQVRRLPVMDRNKRLVGILSLGDVAQQGETGASGEAVAGISQPGGAHSG